MTDNYLKFGPISSLLRAFAIEDMWVDGIQVNGGCFMMTRPETDVDLFNRENFQVRVFMLLMAEHLADEDL